MKNSHKVNRMNTRPMTNGEHFSFMEAALVQIKSFAQSEALASGEKKARQSESAPAFADRVADFESAFKREDDMFSFTRKSGKTADIASANKARWDSYCVYKRAVKVFVKFPDEQKSAPASRLLENINSYNLKGSASIEDRSGGMSNMAQDLEGALKSDVKALGLSSVVENMVAQNEKVKALQAARNKERSKTPVGEKRAARLATDEAYRACIDYVNALSTLGAADGFDNFIAGMNSLAARANKAKAKGQGNANSSVDSSDGDAEFSESD